MCVHVWRSPGLGHYVTLLLRVYYLCGLDFGNYFVRRSGKGHRSPPEPPPPRFYQLREFERLQGHTTRANDPVVPLIQTSTHPGAAKVAKSKILAKAAERSPAQLKADKYRGAPGRGEWPEGGANEKEGAAPTLLREKLGDIIWCYS